MDIKELKNKIENKEFQPEFMYLKYTDTDFVAKQYVKAISDILQIPLNYISLEEVQTLLQMQSSFLLNTADSLYIYAAEKKDEIFSLQNISSISNLIIIGSTTFKPGEAFYEYQVEIPALTDWQIKNYMQSIAEEVPEEDLNTLYDLCGGSIYRIDKELEKFTLFSKEERKNLFKKYKEDGLYKDMSTYNVFDISNAILKRDKDTLFKILSELNAIDCEPIGLLVILVNNFRNIINVQLNPAASPEKCGLKPGQFWALKHSCGCYTKDQLFKIYKNLTSLDRKIKSGEFPVDLLVDYLISYIFSVE